MPSSSEIVPDRSSPEHRLSPNQHSAEEATQATDTVTVTEEAPTPRRMRPSRACTVRSQQRLQEQQAAERKFKQPKKEQKRQRREEDVDDREDEDGDESPRNEQQCGGGTAAKIVTSLVQPPESSQVPRRSLRSMWELASILNFLHVSTLF